MKFSSWFWPSFVSVYHISIFVGGMTFLFDLTNQSPPLFSTSDASPPSSPSNSSTSRLLYVVITCGTLGATLTASRYVIQAVRRKNYDIYRLPWQILTPIHGAILAVIALFVVKSGLALTSTNANDYIQTLIFFSALSFIVGFAAEMFVKALIRAAEGLFNERSDLSEKNLPSREDK